MGGFLGTAVQAGGHQVLWAGAGRSQATRARAAGFLDVGSLVELVGRSDVILSVCPPEAALEVATDVATLGFAGVYVDLNAVSPQTVRAIADLLPRVIDGAVIGGPAIGDAVVHLCGRDAEQASALFDPATVEVRRIGSPLGTASALKACYAASSKAGTALLLTARAAARASGVEEALLAEWQRTQPGVVERTDRSLRSIGAKAWRFGGEMEEAAAFFASIGAADGFSQAAAAVYDRLADLRDRAYEPDDVMDRVVPPGANPPGAGQ
jgi:3-hydroxyisobutyrate dehydrogenase-like beta-hydroxyacid dehydrogenase